MDPTEDIQPDLVNKKEPVASFGCNTTLVKALLQAASLTLSLTLGGLPADPKILAMGVMFFPDFLTFLYRGFPARPEI
jgi:hypothetical protein